MTLSEIEDIILAISAPKYRAKQIFDWLQLYGAMNYEEMSNVPKSLRTELADKFPIFSCEIELKQVSKIDGTVKYLIKLSDGNYIESVLMKYKYGYTLCVSSQVGCRMGCVFCASTKSGRVRNLQPSEILGQIHIAQRDMNIRVSHIVMMGMGEPLDNYENTLRFLSLVTDENGLNISMRNISLSTCGIVPKIYDLLDKRLQLTLSISLHAPNNKIRSEMMPINNKYPVEELVKACKLYSKQTSRRISFEYTMINGVNDSDACAYELASLLKGTLCHVNLIPVNEIKESSHKRSTNETLQRFMSILNSRGINTTVRRSLGSDIDASCGQLRSKYVQNSDAKEEMQ